MNEKRVDSLSMVLMIGTLALGGGPWSNNGHTVAATGQPQDARQLVSRPIAPGQGPAPRSLAFSTLAPDQPGGDYPTTWRGLSERERGEVFNRFNVVNGGDWKEAYPSNLGPRKVSFDGFGFIESAHFPHPTGPDWRNNLANELKQIKAFILRNQDVFGVPDPSVLREPTMRSAVDSRSLLYAFDQPKLMGYIVSQPPNEYPPGNNWIEVFLVDSEVMVARHFYPNISLPASRILDLDSLKRRLLGQKYTYAAGCEDRQRLRLDRMPCDPYPAEVAITEQDLLNLGVQKTQLVPLTFVIKETNTAKLQVRLVRYVTGIRHRALLYVDAIDGTILACFYCL